MDRDGAALAYRPDLDGLRGLAILLVLAYHVAPTVFPGGFVGVDVFFVLSGYLITRILRADREPGRLRRFYAKRVRRLAPALVIVLVATLLLGNAMLVDSALRELAHQSLAATVFAANLLFWSQAGYFDAAAADKPLLHLWSLGVEEQFYLAWPLLLGWLGSGRDRAARAVAWLATASFLGCSLYASRAPEAVFYLPWFRFWELLAGALLALRPALGVPISAGARAEAAALLGTAGILGFAVVAPPAAPFPSRSAPSPVLGSAVLIAAGERSRVVGVIFGARPAVALGKISYPLYLWHWPLVVFFASGHPTRGIGSRAAACAAAVPLAWITWKLLEQPARRAYRTRPRVTVAGWSAGMLAVAGTALALAASDGSTPVRRMPEIEIVEEVQHLDSELRRRIGLEACPEVRDDGPGTPSCLESHPEGTGAPLVLWGDSTAESWIPLVHAVAVEEDRRLVVMWDPACPPLVGVGKPGGADGCTKATSAAKLHLVERLRPAAVVLAAAWPAYLPETALPIRYEIELAGSPATSGEVGAALGATLERLLDSVPVVAVSPLPVLVEPLHKALPLHLEYRPRAAEHRRQMAPVARVLEDSRWSGRRFAVLDPAERLCGQDTCEAILGPTHVYLDAVHVTSQGALLFRDDLVAALAVARSGRAEPRGEPDDTSGDGSS